MPEDLEIRVSGDEDTRSVVLRAKEVSREASEI
jgi:hypothetical protein